jgi:hypothetical protein
VQQSNVGEIYGKYSIVFAFNQSQADLAQPPAGAVLPNCCRKSAGRTARKPFTGSRPGPARQQLMPVQAKAIPTFYHTATMMIQSRTGTENRGLFTAYHPND